jgi:23S rRNA (cytidine1920-2'-O)/16S rRNA (cytidine1409-2'-O)-methyltransferase
VDFITADVSFISLRKIFPAMAGWYPESGGQAGVLIKPQFEAQREEAARDSGVIRDPVIHRRVLTEVLESAAANGFQVRGVIRSPLLGPAGNQEFLSWMTFNPRDGEVIDLTDLISPLF